MAYEVFATRWNDAHIVEELIPARGLEMTFPLSDHGDCSFSATVEPGRSWWRAALSCAMSGILICRDGVPLWSGMMLPERQSGPRTFDFQFVEWGAFFETTPAVAFTVTNTNDHTLFRRLLTDAQAVAGQNVGVLMGSTLGAATSDLTINAWDSTNVAEEQRRLSDAAGGPEWYYAATGTLENPTRTLVLGDRLGSTTPTAVLEYVENTQDYTPPEAPPGITPLGNLFPGDQRAIVAGQRRGGNVIAHPARQQSPGITATVAIGTGQESAQLRRYATATGLLAAGYPRRTKPAQYTDVTIAATLQRHANADLAAAQGMTTSYALTTFEDDPDWVSVARGDTVRVELDTDVYSTERPLVFTSRVLDRAVHVPDEGRAQVNWHLSDVRGN